MFPWLVGGWILRQKGQPSFPIVLKHGWDLGVSADADGMCGAAGFGIGWVDAEECGGGWLEFSGDAGDFHRVADQAGGL